MCAYKTFAHANTHDVPVQIRTKKKHSCMDPVGVADAVVY